MKRVFGIFIVMSLLFLGACTTSETNETDLVDTTVIVKSLDTLPPVLPLDTAKQILIDTTKTVK